MYEDRISNFLSPGYFNLGLGFSYNPDEFLQIIFRPANGKLTTVTDPFLQKKGRYGLENDGDKWRVEIGALLNISYRLKLYKDMFLDNQLSFFSNYSYHPERVDILYHGSINLKFNQYISANFNIDFIYDHDQIQNLQRKQNLGIGITYSFGAKNEETKKNKKNFKPFVEK